MNGKIVSIIMLVVAFVMVAMLNTSVYKTQNNEINIVETFDGRGYFDDVSLTFDETIGSGNTVSLEFTNDGNYLAVGINGANKLRVYSWNSVTETYDILSPSINVGGLGNVLSVEFSDDDKYLVVGHTTSPFIKVYDVSNNFNSITDSDLIVNASVRDAKYYGNYLAVGGSMTNFLQVFKYTGTDYVKLSNNIDVLPTGIVTDLEYANGYLHLSLQTSPYIMSYKVEGDSLVYVSPPTNLPNSTGNVIDVSDNGDYIVVGTTGTPYIKAYMFNNGVYTDMTFNITPTQTNSTLALHFIDNSYLYVGGDLSVYKYKIIDGNFIQQTNDVTTFQTPVNVLDCNTVLGRFVLGDVNDYELYIGSSVITFDVLELQEEPDSVNSVIQLGQEKDYVLIGNLMSISNELYNQEITVDYNYIETNENNILEIIPIFAILALVYVVGRMVITGGKNL